MVAAKKPIRRKARALADGVRSIEQDSDRDAERQRDREALVARLDHTEAQRDALHTALRDVLATLPNEWAPAEIQAVRRRAKAVIEETSGERTKGAKP
jgi:hypothetical protein